MSIALFPDEDPAGLERSMHEYDSREDTELFLAERPDGSIAGFVEAGTRPYADGCDTSPVGFIEAWFVDPDVRQAGYGRALLAAAEDWGRSRGYSEMGSDALLDNLRSHQAHERCGYEEVGRVVQFRKVL